MRPEQTSPEIEDAERNWWNRFAQLENEVSWVQTDSIQAYIRGEYVKKIIACCPPGGTILDLGCGTGWLDILLVRFGASRVIGYDFSESQIEIAKQNALRAKMGDAIQFEVVDAARMTVPSQQFDVVVLHAFLHHLFQNEISDVLESAKRLLKPKGKLVIFEPVMYPQERKDPTATKLIDQIQYLIALPERGTRFGLRRFSGEEQKIRKELDARHAGVSPHGPSPKEMPFSPDEVEKLISRDFELVERLPVLAKAHHVAQAVILLAMSHPIRAKLMKWPLLARGRRLDQKLIRLSHPAANTWIFELFICQRKPDHS